MSTDDKKALELYLKLKKERPDLFHNPIQGGIRIIADPDEILMAEQAGKAYLINQGLDPEWGRLGLISENEIFRVLRDPVRFPDNKLGIYIRILMQERVIPGAVIFAVYKSKVVLLEQFRHATRSYHLEIPRGFGEIGISPKENAYKEIREEIQGEITRLEPLGPMHVNTGISNEFAELFFAELSSLGQGQLSEAIRRICLVSIAELEAQIRSGEVTDAFSLGAFTRARLRGFI